MTQTELGSTGQRNNEWIKLTGSVGESTLTRFTTWNFPPQYWRYHSYRFTFLKDIRHASFSQKAENVEENHLLSMWHVSILVSFSHFTPSLAFSSSTSHPQLLASTAVRRLSPHLGHFCHFRFPPFVTHRHMVMMRYSENTLPLTDVLPLSLSLSLLFLPVAAVSFNCPTPTPTLPLSSPCPCRW